MNLPTKSGDYEMPEAVAAAYLKLYPSAEYEFARMAIWLEANPSRRPASPKSAPKFVANWFRRVPQAARQSPAASRAAAFMASLREPLRQSEVINVETTNAAASRLLGA
ncbi:MAG: hypothetical protein RL756_1743 [Pseudomonadota bacterium]|jgi:hypothetical protein